MVFNLLEKFFQKNSKILFFVLGFFLAFGFSLYASGTWTNPTASPPNGNPSLPINEGSIEQKKSGNLIVGPDSTSGVWLQADGDIFGRDITGSRGLFVNSFSVGAAGIVEDGYILESGSAISGSELAGVQLSLDGLPAGGEAGLSLRSSAAGTPREMGRLTAWAEGAWDGTAANLDSALRFYNARDGVSLEQMRLSSNGFLGLGISSPLAKIHLNNGGIRFSGTGSIGAGSDPGIFGTSGASNSLEFSVGGQTRLFINGSGNIGIGTNSPSSRLHVSGSVRATQFCIGTACKTSWTTPLSELPAGAMAGYCEFATPGGVQTGSVVSPAINQSGACGCQSGWVSRRTGDHQSQSGVPPPVIAHYACTKS